MARTRGELAAELTAQRLHELYVDQRLSYRAIARQIGCSDHTVAAPVRRLDLERPPTPARPALDATTVNEILRLYTENVWTFERSPHAPGAGCLHRIKRARRPASSNGESAMDDTDLSDPRGILKRATRTAPRRTSGGTSAPPQVATT